MVLLVLWRCGGVEVVRGVEVQECEGVEVSREPLAHIRSPLVLVDADLHEEPLGRTRHQGNTHGTHTYMHACGREVMIKLMNYDAD